MTPIRRLLLVAVVLALALAGCGSSEEEPAAGGGSAGSGTASADGGAFPARATHRFGTTVVPERPERIVVVGLTEHDTLLALGHRPVATTEWYGRRPGAIWPWAREAMGSGNPEVLSNVDGFQYEKIAALRPDLILGTNAGMQRADYDKLSQIAPTVAGPQGGTDWFSPWDEQTVLIAQALGDEDAGHRLVEDVRAQYAAVADAHPEWNGKTATFSQNGFYDGLLYVYPPGLNTEFLSYLGFEINPKLTPLVRRAGEQVTVSPERLDVIDADVIVFATEKAQDIANLKKVPTFDKLDAVAGRRAVFTDGTLAGALYFMTPLSLPWALERLAPQLEAAVDGSAPQQIVAAED
jgi:iron complex transport system substrate-binding protein